MFFASEPIDWIICNNGGGRIPKLINSVSGFRSRARKEIEKSINPRLASMTVSMGILSELGGYIRAAGHVQLLV